MPNPAKTKTILLPFAQNDKFGFHRLNRHLAGDFLRNMPKSSSLSRIWLADDDGYTFIAAFSHRARERSLRRVASYCKPPRSDVIRPVLNPSQCMRPA